MSDDLRSFTHRLFGRDDDADSDPTAPQTVTPRQNVVPKEGANPTGPSSDDERVRTFLDHLFRPY